MQRLIDEIATETDTEYLNILLAGFNEAAATEKHPKVKRDLEASATEVGKRLEVLRDR